MRKLLFAAVTAAALVFVVPAGQANASWLSQTIRSILNPGPYGAYGYYGPAYTYYNPSYYSYTPFYGYYSAPYRTYGYSRGYYSPGYRAWGRGGVGRRFGRGWGTGYRGWGRGYRRW